MRPISRAAAGRAVAMPVVLTIIVAGGCLDFALAAPLVLDSGGFSIDISKSPATQVTGESLLPDGDMEALTDEGALAAWQPASYVWLPSPDASAQARMQERLKRLMRHAAATDRPFAGARAMELAIPAAAYDAADPPGHELCAYYHQTLPLPPLEADTAYVLRWQQRGRSAPDISNSRAYARITFYDNEDPAKGAQPRVYAQVIFQPSDAWRPGELEFTAPRATRCVDVRLALTGVGEVLFDDASLHRTLVQDVGPTVRLMPAAYLDNLCCLSSGDAGVLTFGFRNPSGVAIAQPRLVVQLPPWVEVLDTAPTAALIHTQPATFDGARVTQHVFDIEAWKGRIRDGNFAYPHNMWEGLTLLVRTSQPPSEALQRGCYWLEDGEYRSTPLDFDIKVVPPIARVDGPRQFRSGVHLFLVHGFRQPAAVEAFARLYGQVGLNSVHVPASPLGAEFGRLGLERYAQPIANGYRMGSSTPGEKPEDAVFRLVDGTPQWEATCPTEVYMRGPYFTEKIHNGILRQVLVTDRSAEQLMCNWEPFMYNGKGCFCDRCRAEFAAYSRLPAAEVGRVWPGEVIAEYGELWLRFRAWQHGKLMVTLEETVRALGAEAGPDAHFIPEIHYSLLTTHWDRHAGNAEYAAVEYMDRLPIINAWAPYNWYVFGRGPYDYIRGQHLNIHVTASEVQEFLAASLPAPKRPRLIAFPYGTYEGATEPEAIAFETLTYFLDGYYGAFVYLFPGGYDARYWSALAEVNRQLALCEPYVVGGTPIREHEVAPETPLPDPDPRFLATCRNLSDPARWEKLPLLLSWEFRQGRARFIAVGNFWERGECFFRLRLQDLRPEARYLLREPATGRIYVGDEGSPAVSANELSRGILLHAGAMRYSCFVLEPYTGAPDAATLVRRQDMEAAMADRLPAIREAVQYR